MNSVSHRRDTQRGAALLLALIVVSALLIPGIVALNAAVFQHRLAGNFEGDFHAELAAHTARRHALAWLFSRPDDQRKIADKRPPIPAVVEGNDLAWWRQHAEATPSRSDAFWLLEPRHAEPSEIPGVEIAYYRIVALGARIGAGTAHPTLAVQESIVARPWGGDYETPPLLEVSPMVDLAAPLCRQFDPGIPCGQLGWHKRK